MPYSHPYCATTSTDHYAAIEPLTSGNAGQWLLTCHSMPYSVKISGYGETKLSPG